MKIIPIVMVLVATLLAGCVSAEGERAKVLQEGRDYCAAKGKQFIPGDVKQTGIPNLTTYHTVLAGSCVGKGDPGYIEPSAAPAAGGA